MPQSTVGGGPGGVVIVPIPPPVQSTDPTQPPAERQVIITITDPLITEIRVTRRKTNTTPYCQLTVNRDSVVTIDGI